jgi:molybdopterin/thiamine biosynthesis adenylyltransferase
VKVEAAQAALKAINPDVEVVPLHQRVEDFSKLVADADVVLDCSDNFATRHALNRACVAARKPLVAGAAIRFDAQLMVFDLRQKTSPCYSCVFPEDAEVEEVSAVLHHGRACAPHRRDRRDAGDGGDQAGRRRRHVAEREASGLRCPERGMAHREGRQGSGVRSLQNA